MGRKMVMLTIMGNVLENYCRDCIAEVPDDVDAEELERIDAGQICAALDEVGAPEFESSGHADMELEGVLFEHDEVGEDEVPGVLFFRNRQGELQIGE